MLNSFMLIFFAMAFVLIQDVVVKIVSGERLRVEVHFPLLALILSPRKHKKRKQRRLSPPLIGALLERARYLLGKSSVSVQHLPTATEATSAYRGFGIAGAFLGLVESAAQSFKIHDDAFTLSPDNKSSLVISFRVRLIFLTSALIGAGTDLIKFKSRRIN